MPSSMLFTQLHMNISPIVIDQSGSQHSTGPVRGAIVSLPLA